MNMNTFGAAVYCNLYLYFDPCLQKLKRGEKKRREVLSVRFIGNEVAVERQRANQNI